MGSLMVVEKETDCQAVIDWPLDYMNDFSVLGLRVARLAGVLELLEAAGYHVARIACGAAVDFEDRNRFNKIFEILTQHRIEHVLSDLAECAYQG